MDRLDPGQQFDRLAQGALERRKGQDANKIEMIEHIMRNIATGETSQAITPFHFFDNFNFHQGITYITK